MGMTRRQFHNTITPKVRDSRGRGDNDHPVGNSHAAGAVQVILPFDLYHAELTSFIAQIRSGIFYAFTTSINGV